jgi:hypothetical protein
MINITMSDLLKHLAYWENITDEQILKNCTTDEGLDAEKALCQMLERELCIATNREFIKSLSDEQK